MEQVVPSLPPTRSPAQILEQTRTLQARGFLNCSVPTGFSKSSLFKKWFPDDTQRLRTKRYQHASTIWPTVFDVYPVTRLTAEVPQHTYEIQYLVPKRHILCEQRPNVRWIHSSHLWSLRPLFLLPHEHVNLPTESVAEATSPAPAVSSSTIDKTKADSESSSESDSVCFSQTDDGSIDESEQEGDSVFDSEADDVDDAPGNIWPMFLWTRLWNWFSHRKPASELGKVIEQVR